MSNRFLRIGLILSVFSLGLTASCNGGQTTQPAPGTTSHEKQDLSSLLVTLNDLPPQWTNAPAGLSSSRTLCGETTDAFSSSQRLKEESATFRSRDGRVLIAQSVDQYDVAFAVRSFNIARSILEGCSTWVDTSGTSAAWNRIAWSPPPSGDDVLGARATLESPGADEIESFVYVSRFNDLTNTIFVLVTGPNLDSVTIANGFIGTANRKFELLRSTSAHYSTG